jgi:small-conductance mechanosensitive channel
MWTDWINFGISFLLVFVSLFLAARLLLALLMRLARQTTSEYDEAYLRSIRPQIHLLVLVISLDFATTRLLSILDSVKQALAQLYFAVIVLIIAVIIWKLIGHLVLWYQDLAKKSGESDHKEAALQLGQRAGHILVIIISSLLILDNFGINVSALVATLGIGGLALSLAAQETLSNMISGIMILMDQPFRIGDRIEIQGLNTWGDVVDIGLRSTRIRTRDNRMVIVPNSSISKNQVINYTFPDPRYRVQIDIGVIYGSDLRIVREVITQAVRDVEGVLADRPVDVLFMDFNESKMNLRVRWWIESYTDSRQEFDKVNEVIYLALKEAKIEMPSSTTTIEIAKARDAD